MRVSRINNRQCHWMVRNYHYAALPDGYHPGCEPKGRMPSILQAFGLFEVGSLVGVCVFSKPASYTLCDGVCGREHRARVIELARLVVTTKTEYAAGYLVSRSLRQLENKPWIVVSYADPNEGHVGYIYQATNWLYTGRGNAEPWWRHPATQLIVSKTRRHIEDKAQRLGLDWTDLIRERKEGKHRYVTFVGNRKERKLLRQALRYEVVGTYPKGDTKRFAFSPTDELPLWSLSQARSDSY